MKYFIFVTGIFWFIANSLYSQEPTNTKKAGPQMVLKEQNLRQGRIRYKVAEEYFNDGFYSASIKKITELLYLFPKHPMELKSLQLLSKAFKKNDQLVESIHVDMEIYRKYSTTEDGLNAYLDAGRKTVKIGDIEKAKKILNEIKHQVYSSKLAKDAEIELEQLEILEGNFSIPKPSLN